MKFDVVVHVKLSIGYGWIKFKVTVDFQYFYPNTTIQTVRFCNEAVIKHACSI